MALTTTHGTAASVFRGAPYRSAGKTGTAQVVNRGARAVDPRSLPLWKRHRALYIGYAPVESPSIVVAVAVEGGGFGASSAAPIARKVFDAWLLGRMPEAKVPEAPEGGAVIAKPDFGNVTGSPDATLVDSASQRRVPAPGSDGRQP